MACIELFDTNMPFLFRVQLQHERERIGKSGYSGNDTDVHFLYSISIFKLIRLLDPLQLTCIRSAGEERLFLLHQARLMLLEPLAKCMQAGSVRRKIHQI